MMRINITFTQSSSGASIDGLLISQASIKDEDLLIRLASYWFTKLVSIKALIPTQLVTMQIYITDNTICIMTRKQFRPVKI